MRLQLPFRASDELPRCEQASAGHPLVIVMYHAVVRRPLEVYDWCFVDASAFRGQVDYLKRHFEILSVSEAVEGLMRGTIHRPAAAISFDDGFQSTHDLAFPILEELDAPATVFVVTSLVDTADTTWPCRLHRGLTLTRKSLLEFDGMEFDLVGAAAKAETLRAIAARLKELPYHRLLEDVDRIVIELGDDPRQPIESDSPYRMLSRQAIADMARSGLFEFGSHSVSHVILSLLSPAQCREEIERSVAAVRHLTGRPCTLFAYPNGRAQDYDDEAIRILRSCGVRAAVTAIEGVNDGTTPVMELRRVGIGADCTIRRFKKLVRRR